MAVLMTKDVSLNPVEIDLVQLDSEDRRFAVTPQWFPLERLELSIRETGITTPLRVERTGDPRLRIVSGFRRFAIAQRLGLQTVPCFTAMPLPPREMFLTALWENMGSRSFSDVERAIALQKLKLDFGYTEEDLIRDFLPPLGLRADRYHLERYLEIARTPEILQRGLAVGQLHLDTVLAVSSWKPEELRFLVDLITRYSLGRNRQRELVGLLQDLAVIEGKPVSAIWEESGAGSVDRDEQLSPQDRIGRTRTALRRLRFPRLTEYEDRFRSLKSALRLPSGLKLGVPPYFEGDSVSIRMEARSVDELRRLLTEGAKLRDREELGMIFELL